MSSFLRFLFFNQSKMALLRYRGDMMNGEWLKKIRHAAFRVRTHGFQKYKIPWQKSPGIAEIAGKRRIQHILGELFAHLLISGISEVEHNADRCSENLKNLNFFSRFHELGVGKSFILFADGARHLRRNPTRAKQWLRKDTQEKGMEERGTRSYCLLRSK